MTNTIKDFNQTLEKLHKTKEAYDRYMELYKEFFDFLNRHVEKPLYEYKAPIRCTDGSRDLDDVCRAFIIGSAKVEAQYKQLEYAIKDAMEVSDFM